MFSVSVDQIEQLDNAIERKFEDEMVSHSHQFSPFLSDTLGPDGLRALIKNRIETAYDLSLTRRGTIRQFIELGFLFGGRFFDDPQYPWAIEALSDITEDNQMQRAEQLHAGTLNYINSACGEQNTHVWSALSGVSVLARAEDPVPVDQFERWALSRMRNLHPKKAELLGDEALKALIAEATALAETAKFEPGRETALIAILMFAFGHGCTTDLAYPWIGRTLRDTEITDERRRAKRLERKAISWLDHVLARRGDAA